MCWKDCRISSRSNGNATARSRAAGCDVSVYKHRCADWPGLLDRVVWHVQTVTQHHVLQKGGDIKAQQKQQLDQYAEDQIVSPAQSYFNETLKEHLQGLAPNLTAVHSHRSLVQPPPG